MIQFSRLAVIACILWSALCHAQADNHFGLFPTLDVSGALSPRLGYSFYYFAGFNLVNSSANAGKQPSDLFVLYAEQALSYSATRNLSFTGSYLYERQRPLTESYRNENRFYLQATYQYDIGKTSIKHRLRFDGRFIQNRTEGKTPFTHRLRYLAGLSVPISGSKEKYYLTAYNEFFFNSYKAATAIYGENWAYAGIGLKTNNAGNFEAGPLYIF